jgi:hypothetical protein
VKRGTHGCWFILALGLVPACQRQPSHGPDRKPAPATTATAAAPTLVSSAHAKLPLDEGPFYPSLMRVADSGVADVAAMANVQACASCHAEATHQWQSSAHAHASFDNPWYRASVDGLRSDVGYGPSKHCAGCHDPLPLLAGSMDKEVQPTDPLASAGVTCLVCHSIQSATPDGNASFTLTTAPVPIPKPGDAESLQRHRERLASKALRTPVLCASCHRGFLGRHTGISHHLSGMDEPGAWRASAFGGSHAGTLEHVTEQTCTDCHMAKEAVLLREVSAHDGALRSHRFAGAHTALAAQSGDALQQSAIVAQLQRGVRLDVPVVRRGGQPFAVTDAVTLKAGEQLTFDVTLRSYAVGHQFPGGLKDLQDTWLEFDVRDHKGRLLATAGRDQASREDPSAFVLRATVVDAEGHAETRHLVTHFGTVAYDHTIAALGARVTRYQLTLPTTFEGPLSVQARLKHRKHRVEAREIACAASRSERGRAFASAARRAGSKVIDGCSAEPITLVTQTSVVVGDSQQADHARDVRPLPSRLYDHALGLSSNVQEQLDEARWSIERALSELHKDPKHNTEDEANLLVLRGRIDARQGRLEDALQSAASAQALLGLQPAISRVRADAYAAVWRWPQCAAELTQLTQVSPFDTAAFRDLAKARYSADDAAGALQAAHTGLGLQPRDEALLRVQTVALETLKSPEAAAAREAFLFYREADETTTSKLACDQRTANCMRDRLPVVTIELTAAR